MSEQSKVLAASLAGAAIGGLIGYLYLTPSGRRMREQLEPRLEEFSQEMRKLRGTMMKAQEVASEGWRSLQELVGDRGDRQQGRQWSGQPPRQATPF